MIQAVITHRFCKIDMFISPIQIKSQSGSESTWNLQEKEKAKNKSFVLASFVKFSSDDGSFGNHLYERIYMFNIYVHWWMILSLYSRNFSSSQRVSDFSTKFGSLLDILNIIIYSSWIVQVQIINVLCETIIVDSSDEFNA